MAIINQRWPRDICPETCVFTRDRNDVLQVSPRSRATKVIRQGRPLWRADCTWTLPNTERLAKLRYWLEAIDGYSGSVQVWDFASPYPFGLDLVTADAEGQRLFWTYLGTRQPWDWQGFPAHWLYSETVTAGDVAAIGDTSVDVSGLTPGGLVAVQGQYVQIGRRLYIVAANVSADGSGDATIDLVSPLLAAVAVDDEIRFAEAACEMRLETQSFDARASAGSGTVSVSASFIETVEDYE